MRKYSIDWHNHKKIFFVYWWICFFYTAFVAVFVQFIFLPYIAPSLHIGGGFMAELDCSTFHQYAVDLSCRIRENGWHEWKLDPGVGTGISGVAAIFYTLFVPKLWVMIPFNAFVHATSGLFIAFIGCQIFKDIKLSLISSIPFIIMPSAALWYAQFHKDGLTFLGWFMVFYAAVLVSGFSNSVSLKRRMLQITALLFLGYFTFTTARQYHAEIFIVFVIASTILLSLMLAIEFVKHGRVGKKQFSPFVLFVIVSVILANSQNISLNIPGLSYNFFKNAAVDNFNFDKKSVRLSSARLSSPSLSSPSLSNVAQNTETKAASDANSTNIGLEVLNESQNEGDTQKRFAWDKLSLESLKKKVNSIINKANNAAIKIRSYRQSYINSAGVSDAKSNIDLDVNFYTFLDIVRYVPRALQLAFFAPFPNKWFEKGRVPANTFMKRIAIFEMIVVYTGLLGIPFLFLNQAVTRKKEVIVLFAGSLTVMLPLILVMTNVGIIYRVRYGFLMLLVGAGFAGLMNFFFVRKTRHLIGRPC